jgi:SAM-dependent methyltransferase
MRTGRLDNLLLQKPWLYECIYPESFEETALACSRIIEKFASRNSERLEILDVGCGTGRVLARLVQAGHKGTGIDISEPMLEYARFQHPELDIAYGDMRSFNLGKSFDVITCVGSTFTYNLSNADVHKSLENFRKHLRDEGLLVLDILNASRFLSSEAFNERMETEVSQGNFHAKAVSRHILNRRRQSFRRIRTWIVEGESSPITDDAQYRLFFPLELEDYLSQHDFDVLGMWDNKELIETDFTGRRLYVAARAV